MESPSCSADLDFDSSISGPFAQHSDGGLGSTTASQLLADRDLARSEMRPPEDPGPEPDVLSSWRQEAEEGREAVFPTPLMLHLQEVFALTNGTSHPCPERKVVKRWGEAPQVHILCYPLMGRSRRKERSSLPQQQTWRMDGQDTQNSGPNR